MRGCVRFSASDVCRAWSSSSSSTAAVFSQNLAMFCNILCINYKACNMVECAEIVALVLGLVEGCPLDNFGARHRAAMLYGPVDHNKNMAGQGETMR